MTKFIIALLIGSMAVADGNLFDSTKRFDRFKTPAENTESEFIDPSYNYVVEGYDFEVPCKFTNSNYGGALFDPTIVWSRSRGEDQFQVVTSGTVGNGIEQSRYDKFKFNMDQISLFITEMAIGLSDHICFTHNSEIKFSVRVEPCGIVTPPMIFTVKKGERLELPCVLQTGPSFDRRLDPIWAISGGNAHKPLYYGTESESEEIEERYFIDLENQKNTNLIIANVTKSQSYDCVVRHMQSITHNVHCIDCDE